MASMPASSREDLRVPWGAEATAFPVEIAIVLEDAGEPLDADYHAATWDGVKAKLLIGKDSPFPLAPGEYVVWTRITTSTEQPVRRSGLLIVGAL